ncbi:fibrillin-1-like [Artemia franciscana]
MTLKIKFTLCYLFICSSQAFPSKSAFDECLLNPCNPVNQICQRVDGGHKCLCKDGYQKFDDGCIDIDECNEDLQLCTEFGEKCVNTEGSFFCGYSPDFSEDTDDNSTTTTYEGSTVTSSSSQSFSTSDTSITSEMTEETTEYSSSEKSSTITSTTEENTPSQSLTSTSMSTEITTPTTTANTSEDSTTMANNGSTVTSSISQSSSTSEAFITSEMTEETTEYSSSEKSSTISVTSESFPPTGHTTAETTTTGPLTCAECSEFASCNPALRFNITCNCLPGFTGDGIICEDIDECSISPSVCDATNQQCDNFAGGYNCLCLDGYQQSGSECIDIDECRENPEFCNGFGEECLNTPGSYNCGCKSGFNETNEGCVDIDECKEDQNLCSGDNQYCSNTIGSYNCLCEPGFEQQGNQDICEDVDECSIENDPVCTSEGQLCNNTVGSYNCYCDEPYYVEEGDLCRATPCKNTPCLNNGTCSSNSTDSYSCRCSDEFEGQNCECISNICQTTYSKCGNATGVMCSPGCTTTTCSCESKSERYNAQNKTCEAFNLCMEDPYLCSGQGQQCEWNVTEGTHKCACKSGYQQNPQDPNICEDIDECAENMCGSTMVCQNNPGSYVCYCEEGYMISIDGTSCQDRNECLNPNDHDCQQSCYNRIGTFGCGCYEQWTPDQEDNKKCRPTDPIINDCPEGADCGNGICKLDSNDGFRAVCFCHPGSEKDVSDLTEKCKSVNECNVGRPCAFDSNSMCVELQRGYSCECKTGYKKSIQDLCVDIDECEDDPCGVGFTCSNSIGSFSCQCDTDGLDPAYEIVAGECRRIDYCESRNGSDFCSSVNGNCINKIDGGFDCLCDPPYVKAGNCDPSYAKAGDYCRFDESLYSYQASLDLLLDWSPDLEDPSSDAFETVRFRVKEALQAATGLNWQLLSISTIPPEVNFFASLRSDNLVIPNPLREEVVSSNLVVYSKEAVENADISISSSCIDATGSTFCYLKNLKIVKNTLNFDNVSDGCGTFGLNSCVYPLQCLSGINPGAYSCQCSTGFRAERVLENYEICEDIDECDDDQYPFPCEITNTTCQNTVGSYDCVCEPPYSFNENGTQCIQWCDVNYCQNGGICDPENQSCDCQSGYFGQFCEVIDLAKELEDSQLSLKILGGVLGGLLGLMIVAVAFLVLKLKRGSGVVSLRKPEVIPPEYPQTNERMARGISVRQSGTSPLHRRKKPTAPMPPPEEKNISTITSSRNPLAGSNQPHTNPLFRDELDSSTESYGSNNTQGADNKGFSID